MERRSAEIAALHSTERLAFPCLDGEQPVARITDLHDHTGA